MLRSTPDICVERQHTPVQSSRIESCQLVQSSPVEYVIRQKKNIGCFKRVAGYRLLTHAPKEGEGFLMAGISGQSFGSMFLSALLVFGLVLFLLLSPPISAFDPFSPSL